MNFTDKNVIITGGSTGIGLATAKAFIKAGAYVLITGRSADSLQKAAIEIKNPKLKTVVSDASNLTGISALENVVSENGQKIDILFLNAGIAIYLPIEQTTEEVFDAQFNTNVKGLFFTLQKLIPHLADGASVVVTSSTSAATSQIAGGSYAATKSAVNIIARVAANELADRKIRVNIVSPGPIETPIFSKAGVPKEVEMQIKANLANAIPSKRIGQPEEIANAVLFLASDNASFISGTELTVDGGMLNYSLK
ncbi:SDR family oxidoreductase [Elizabethkingia anophelis]|uniref:SDR family oxidoreductase n=1 Tax=Elizabethkingia anophelis TaxID=1117645 RepID=UPI0021A55421|nr:SDR family oxidoreductase [Elizabethkingia anophelis]MCT3648405.1 SDR family oxidoreductase [Elizabethkingia anophelis]MCT3695431.1 SDR family oxidoreductase [Elizabethkingia anophelis]MCT3859395.1 SDR family oxidoreductase [Elizabethkingia anophelis]MCT3912700.1 SDR family oxidoreductase [Elizabethkingia anophelis]MCT4311726.1 SDR family oxidoreductase [Elizabethkingia anophelis]